MVGIGISNSWVAKSGQTEFFIAVLDRQFFIILYKTTKLDVF